MATFSGGQTYDPKKAGGVKLPDVPQAQLSTPNAPILPDWSYFGITERGAPDPYDMFRIKNQYIKEGMKMYPSYVDLQLQQMPKITQAALAASEQAFPTQLSQQQRASQAAFEEQMRQYGIAAPTIAAQNANLVNTYAPGYADLLRHQGALTAQQYDTQARLYDPEFFQTYGGLSGRINQGLAAGYDLGSDLEREVQQSLRGAQTARGNYLGPAATAQEAYGLGHEAVDLYNQRIGQAQNFLQGRAPTDLWSSMQGQYGPATTAMGMIGQTAQPGVGLISPSVQPTAGLASAAGIGSYQAPSMDWSKEGLQAYNTYTGALGTWAGQDLQSQAAYNTAMIQSASANNEGTFNMYDKQFEQFLFDQGVSQGIYSQPGSTASSMGGMGSMLGSGLGALGSIGGALLGGGGGAAAGGATLAGTGIAGAAAGLGGAGAGIGGALAGVGGAIAGGASAAVGAVGAAASAAAAAFACWLAREVLPERWKEVREWLFTKAPDWFRRVYIYNARRFVARGLTEADKARIREVLEKCLK